MKCEHTNENPIQFTHRDRIHMLGYTALQEQKSWYTANVEYDKAHYVPKRHFMNAMFAKNNNDNTTL